MKWPASNKVRGTIEMEMDKLAQQTFSLCSNSTIIPFLKNRDLLASSVTNGKSPWTQWFFLYLKCLNFGLSDYDEQINDVTV